LIRRYWGAIVADFRREYRITGDQLGELPLAEFRMLLDGLSPDAVWRHIVANHTPEVTGNAAKNLIDSL
jgi:hypothetical protein